MELQTVVGIEKPDFQIGYTTSILMLGSCFVENMGARLEYFKFQADINPCGIVYNPLSVADTLEILLSGKRFEEKDLILRDGKWMSFSHHGRFSAVSREQCLQNINARLAGAVRQLTKLDVLIITWGTAWVYRYRQTGQVVANCHKFPAAEFEHSRLEVEDIVSVYTGLLKRLWTKRPQLKIIFTVSPVRHWKDGAQGNQLSKAVLLLAIDRLVKLSPQVSYFPSYEIVMDELRDYRFYASDMLHVSEQGVDYIWEKFRDNSIAKETLDRMKRIDKLNKILLHRPHDPESEASRELYTRTRQELDTLLCSLGVGS
ncbi:MAG: GSCFA domain-containing protein [Odoribacter sp.]